MNFHRGRAETLKLVVEKWGQIEGRINGGLEICGHGTIKVRIRLFSLFYQTIYFLHPYNLMSYNYHI